MKKWIQNYIDKELKQRTDEFFKDISEQHKKFILEEQKNQRELKINLTKHNLQIESGLKTLVKLVNHLTKEKKSNKKLLKDE